MRSPTPISERAAALIAEATCWSRTRWPRRSATTKAMSIPNSPESCWKPIGLSAMSRAHREILHLARLLDRVAHELPSEDVDRYLIRDAQRLIEAIETLVRLHTAQEEDIYEAVAAH